MKIVSLDSGLINVYNVRMVQIDLFPSSAFQTSFFYEKKSHLCCGVIQINLTSDVQRNVLFEFATGSFTPGIGGM